MAFMKPAADYFTADEALEYVHTDYEGEEKTPAEFAGWYGRLSASGYLDCTDWSGPFDSYDEAIAAVMGLYEVDENGDEIAA